jgi:hypothetical protein
MLRDSYQKERRGNMAVPDIETEIQLILLDLEEAILGERMPCGLYRKGEWQPNDFSRRIMEVKNRETI